MLLLYRWFWAPFVALQFLTHIPITFIPEWVYADDYIKKTSYIFYPMVGIIVGGIGALTFSVCSHIGLSVYSTAIITVVSTAIVTGAFHEDGAADTADALGPHKREDALRAMRDSRIGTFGTVALWALLTLKVSAVIAIPNHDIYKALIAAHILARWTPLPLALWIPYVQTTEGLGGQMTRFIIGKAALAGSILTVIAAFALFGYQCIPLLIAAIIITAITGIFYIRKFGGITGDCLGATNQITETLVLLLFSKGLHLYI